MANVAVEAARNLGAAPGRTALRAVLVVLVVGSGTAAHGARQLDRRATYLDFLLAGGTVHVVRAQGGIAAVDCEQLVAQPWVLRAGAVSEARTVVPATDPGRLVAAYDASAGFADLVAPGAPPPPAGGVHVGPHLADGAGLVAGSRFDVGEGEATVDVLAADARGERFAGAVLVPSAHVVVAECWVEVHPSAAAGGAGLVEGVLAATGPVRVAPLVGTNEFTDVEPGVEPVLGRWWVAGGAALGLVELLVLRQRRRELALYRAVGARRTDVTSCTVLEGLLVAVPSATYALVAATAWLAGAPGLLRRDVVDAATAATGAVGLAALVLAAGGAVLAHDDTAGALRTE